MTRKRNAMIPPWVVRTIAIILLVLSLTLVFLCVVNFADFGWLLASLLIIGGLFSIYCEAMAIITGDPEYVLLDLIIH